MKILIIGGNRFFGKKLARRLLERGDDVTLLNRGQISDDLGSGSVGGLSTGLERLVCDRKDVEKLQSLVGDRRWDIVYDQACFEAEDAKNAAKVLGAKTAHYVFTSSQAVYGLGADLREGGFVPKRHHFTKAAKTTDDYAEAKRQCEAVFAEALDATATFVRLPIVMGPDDYTGRLQFHVDRVKAGQPLHFPNPEASLSFIHSTDAASALEFIGRRAPMAAVNVASKEPLRLSRLLKLIEEEVGKKAVLADAENADGAHSPYGLKQDWWMNVEKLEAAGFKAHPIDAWLPGLSRACAAAPSAATSAEAVAGSARDLGSRS